MSSISVHVYTNPDYTNRYPLIQCFACLNLVNVVIILGRSPRFRRAVAVQCVHAVGNKKVSLRPWSKLLVRSLTCMNPSQTCQQLVCRCR